MFIRRDKLSYPHFTHRLKSVQKIDIASGYKTILVKHQCGHQSNIQAGRKVFLRGTNLLRAESAVGAKRTFTVTMLVPMANLCVYVLV